MTVEHMPDGTKQFTDAQGVVTKHADFSAVLHYQQTGQRLAYDVPEGAAPAPSGSVDPIAAYKERCRNVGKARASKTLLGGK